MKSDHNMKHYLFAFSMLLLCMFGCSKEEDHSGDTAPEETFSPEQLDNLADYSKENGGSAVLIMESGTIIYEDYHNGADSQTATHIHSATKLFWVSACALAKQQGLIDYDEYVSNTITEWQDTDLHPYKNQIKIAHLLTLSSGLSQDFLTISNESNTYQYVVDALDMVSAPNQKFSYGPSNYYVFGVLLERKLNGSGISQNPLEYLETEILDKIGLEYESWAHDQSGNPNIPNGCTLTPRNWVKYGQFLLQGGKWDGEQLIESDLLEEMYVPQGPNPGHGNFAWLNLPDGYGLSTSDSAPEGSPGGMIYYNGYTEIVAGLGAGKNRMYLIPSKNMVIIRQTLLEEDTFEDNEFLGLLLD